MGRIRLLWTSCRGQTLIEFALIAPVLIILLFGIIDFGLMLNQRITLEHAVREGSRYGMVTADCAAIRLRTVDRAGDIIDLADVTVSYQSPDGSAVTSAMPGDNVKVRAAFDWRFPLMSGFRWFHDDVGEIHGHVSGDGRLELAVPDASGCSGP